MPRFLKASANTVFYQLKTNSNSSDLPVRDWLANNFILEFSCALHPLRLGWATAPLSNLFALFCFLPLAISCPVLDMVYLPPGSPAALWGETATHPPSKKHPGDTRHCNQARASTRLLPPTLASSQNEK